MKILYTAQGHGSRLFKGKFKQGAGRNDMKVGDFRRPLKIDLQKIDCAETRRRYGGSALRNMGIRHTGNFNFLTNWIDNITSLR